MYFLMELSSIINDIQTEGILGCLPFIIYLHFTEIVRISVNLLSLKVVSVENITDALYMQFSRLCCQPTFN